MFIKKLFLQDIKWKLLSLTLAILLWLVGTNMNNPTQNRQYTLPLGLHNIDILGRDGLVLLNQGDISTQVRVGIRATRNDLDNLSRYPMSRQREIIVPSIDFRTINLADVQEADGPLQISLPISVSATEEFEHVSVHPNHINVVVDVLETISLPVITIVEGEVDSGGELRPISLANSAVTISGGRTIVESIYGVFVSVEVWGQQEGSVIDNLPLMVLNHAGDNITNQLQLSVQATSATISIWPFRTVNVDVVPTGELAPGFVLAEEITFAPETVSIMGPENIVNNIETITVEVDKTAMAEDFTREIDVADWLPPGIMLAETENNTAITVDVYVEPIERRSFSVPVDNVRIRGFAAIYQILGDAATINVEVSGASALVSALGPEEIALDIDLRNLGIGVHFVPITVDLPEGISLFQAPGTLQVQIHEPAGEEVEALPDDPTDVIEDDVAYPTLVYPTDVGTDDPTEMETIDGTDIYDYDLPTDPTDFTAPTEITLPTDGDLYDPMNDPMHDPMNDPMYAYEEEEYN